MTKTAEIWTHLYNEGLCTAAQVGQAVGIKPVEASRKLRNMAEWGEVVRFGKTKDSTSRISYGITGECLTPYGVALKEILP